MLAAVHSPQTHHYIQDFKHVFVGAMGFKEREVDLGFLLMDGLVMFALAGIERLNIN